MADARARILRPYTRHIGDLRHAAIKALGIFLLIVVAMVMGFWLAVFGTLVAQPFVGLIGILFIIALWMMGDNEVDYRRQITTLMMWFIGLTAIWPSYLAVDIPGLPWLTPPRVCLAMLVFLTLLQFSQSKSARGEVVAVAGASQPALYFYLLFWMCAFGTVALSKSPGASFSVVLQWLLLWNMPFLIAMWVMTDEKVFPRLIRVVLICMAVVFFLTVLEYLQRKPIWFDYIPSFLKIDGPLFAALMTEQLRVGDDRYRARGNFAVHLYFAQYMLLVTPFIVHYVLSGVFKMRMAALALLLFALTVVWMTNTRTGMTGFIIVVAGSFALFGLRRFLKPTSKTDMVAPAIFMSIPIAMMALMVLIAASPRLQSMTIGGAQHRSSDQGRDRQWDKAWAALENNPLGYGGGNSAQLAGRPTSDGLWIVDSFWINMLLDFGVLGALGFFGFMVCVIYSGVRVYLQQADESADLCGPAAVSVAGYVLTMYTISFAGSTPFMLILAGAIMATLYRLKVAAPKTAEVGAAKVPGRSMLSAPSWPQRRLA